MEMQLNNEDGELFGDLNHGGSSIQKIFDVDEDVHEYDEDQPATFPKLNRNFNLDHDTLSITRFEIEKDD